jgi:hypothetical protein
MIPPSAFLSYEQMKYVEKCKYIILISSPELCDGCTNRCGYSHICCKECKASNMWKIFWDLFRNISDEKIITAWNLHSSKNNFTPEMTNKIAIVANNASDNIKIIKNNKTLLDTDNAYDINNFIKKLNFKV